MRCIYVRFDKKTFAGAKVQQFFDIRKRKGDKMARKWTIWHKGGQNGREERGGTEIAIFRVKTFKSDLLKQADYCKAANYSYRPQTTQDCLTWVLGIPKKDDEARKFRRFNYDTCNVS